MIAHCHYGDATWCFSGCPAWTGPRAADLLALADALAAAVTHRRKIDQHAQECGLGECEYDGQDWPALEQAAIDAETAALTAYRAARQP